MGNFCLFLRVFFVFKSFCFLFLLFRDIYIFALKLYGSGSDDGRDVNEINLVKS